MKETVRGTCIFCGQDRIVQVPEDFTPEYADRVATEECFCEGSARDRLKTQTLESVNTVFGMECEGNFKPVDEDEMDYIIKSVNALVNGTVTKVTMSIKSGGQCKLKFKDITCIEVLREEKHTIRRSN